MIWRIYCYFRGGHLWRTARPTEQSVLNKALSAFPERAILEWEISCDWCALKRAATPEEVQKFEDWLDLFLQRLRAS